MIGGTITWLLDTWKRLEEIRSIRQKSKQVGLSETELKLFDDRITRTVDEAIDTRTKQLLEEYKSDNGRRHELEISLNRSQRALLSRIERGMRIEVHVIPPPEPAEKEGEGEPTQQDIAFAQLAKLSKELEFSAIKGEPMLQLTSP